jgi:hypothetical protein
VTRLATLLTFAAVGVAVTLVAMEVDGARGATGAATAWLLCAVPLLRGPWVVADRRMGRRIRGGWSLIRPWAILFRFGFVLGGGFALFLRWGDAVGTGFWLDLAVLYQAMLFLTVAEMTGRRRASAVGVSGDRNEPAKGDSPYAAG